jgi:hypothetical protein
MPDTYSLSYIDKETRIGRNYFGDVEVKSQVAK